MRTDEFLEELLNAPSPSGYEEEALKVFDKYCETRGFHELYKDKLGNHVYSISKYDPNLKTILISGHIDQVCARVSKINNSGLISFVNSGGMCLKSLVSSHVHILGDNGVVEGVVAKIALHLDNDRDSIGKFKDYKIDVGAESKEEVEALGIYPGCLIIYKPDVNINFGKNRIASTSLDDKLGVYIVSKAASRLSHINNLGYNILVGAMVQEEVGSGAQIAARNISPDISIDVDCTWADSELGMCTDEVGDIELGKGPVIAYGADKSRRLNSIIKDTANSNNISIQTETTRNGGTNTWKFLEYSKDCECALISYPLRSMHSSVEVCDWRDVYNLINLIEETILHLE